MKIGIVGAGSIGSTLARKLANAGHSVAIANSRGPETLTKLADETGRWQYRRGTPREAWTSSFFRFPLLRCRS
jgi:predicted dinucleotide-binding enzyme